MAEYVTVFPIDEKGDVSGRDYGGTFKIKTRLSHMDRLRQDQAKRALLGGADPNAAGSAAQSVAECLSQISIRVLESPSWWKDSDNGLQLPDFNIIDIVFKKCIEAENAEIEKVQKAAQLAKEALDKPIIKE